MSISTQLYLHGFIDLNDQDWTRKAVLGQAGQGVYGSGSDCGVYAIMGAAANTSGYGLKALKGNGKGAVFTQGDVHVTDGKLGIGTQAPAEALDVVGAVKFGPRADAGAAGGTVRWNPALSKLQVFDGAQWANLN